MAEVNISTDFEGPPKKKPNLGTDTTNKTENIHDTIKDLSGFKLKKVLSNNTNRKSVFLSGTFENGGDAVVLLEKTAFSEEHLIDENKYFSKEGTLEKVFQNDIYGDYTYFPTPKVNTIKTTIIHPATEKHIQKYSAQKFHIIDETPTIYNEITLPHINGEQFNVQWVYNILEHKSETERIVFEDTDPETGFVLLPDLKWNGEVDTLYLLAISNARNIKSIRDLTSKHLPLLKNIQEKCKAAIKEKYGLDGTQLRIYLHYQPSFYHLHVHFTYLRHEAPGIVAERAHLLTTVINNLELVSDYYTKATIPFTVRENDNLFKKLKESGFILEEDTHKNGGK